MRLKQYKGFSGGSDDKESTCNAGDLGWIPGLGRSPGERKGSPLQYSGLENSKDCIVHGVAKSQTQLSDSTFTFTLGFPYSLVGKESAYNAGDPDSIPGSGRSAAEGIGYPLQYSWASLVSLFPTASSQFSDQWKLLSRVWLFATPWTIQSLEFSRPEYWSG